MGGGNRMMVSFPRCNISMHKGPGVTGCKGRIGQRSEADEVLIKPEPGNPLKICCISFWLEQKYFP